METRFLKEIGLTDNEIRIYLELLKSGESLASALSEKTDINRTLTYQILNNLAKRGLIGSVIKNNVKYFRAAHPSKIIEFLKEKEMNIQSIIPELASMKAAEEKNYSVELYEGKEGLKTVLNEVIRIRPKEFLDITSGSTTVVLPYYIDKWQKLRVKSRIKAMFLMNDTVQGRKRAKELGKHKLTEIRLLPKGLESPSHIYVYADKVAIGLWSEDHPFVILITSDEISRRFREFFEWFWNISKK